MKWSKQTAKITISSKLSVAGTIESTSGGVKFPDGTTQTTAGGGGLGVGQTWQSMAGNSTDCSGPRASGVVCTNNTGKPIVVAINVQLNAYVYAGPFYSYFYINGSLIEQKVHSSSGTNVVTYFMYNYIIPPGSTYQFSGGNLASWFELR